MMLRFLCFEIFRVSNLFNVIVIFFQMFWFHSHYSTCDEWSKFALLSKRRRCGLEAAQTPGAMDPSESLEIYKIVFRSFFREKSQLNAKGFFSKNYVSILPLLSLP